MEDQSEFDGPIHLTSDRDERSSGVIAETTSGEPVVGREKGWLLAKGNSLVKWCVLALIGFGVLAVFFDIKSDEFFGQIIDVLKLVVTTVMAYLFGAHGFSDNKKEDG